MTEQYFEQIEVGATDRTRFYSVSEAEIVEFALSWNPEPYHIDPAAAAQHQLGRIFACGPHIIAIATKLGNEQRPRPVAIAGLGWDELRFKAPVFGGDRLCLETQVADKRRSQSNPQQGIVTYALRILNQDEQVVMTYRITFLAQCQAQA
ncbi:MaoC family dehydratase [Ferrimonas pelagia]|uniref:MaoC/PaaZ C-terminal domain-containing protein n=1 Tax=Ferrimonas pelagia TaxID=1177826 RepID=A0ABP9FHQ9_9GAMM